MAQLTGAWSGLKCAIFELAAKKCMVGEGGSLGIIHWIKNGKSTGIGVIHWIKNGKSTGGGYADGLIRVMVVCSAFIKNFR